MSAFENSKRHFETVRTSLEHNWSLYRDQQGIFNRLIWPNHIDNVYNEIEKIVGIWQRLQMETVNNKYSHIEPKRTAEDLKKYLELSGNYKAGDKLNRTQLYKALECIFYQIELEQLNRELKDHEAEAMDKLETLLQELPRDILRDTEEYNQAEWAII